MNLNALKNKSSFDKLTKALETLGGSPAKKASDERFWQPTVDKAGNGYAVIRFLDSPQVDGEDGMPWAQVFSHGFKGPSGSWFIENCPTSLGGQKCPVCESNSALWNSGIEANKSLVSGENGRKRKLSYISNILVIKDSNHPENEGKVFLYKYGKKIFDKIKAKLEPEFEDEDKINPFNFWKGANFKLKIRNVMNYRNYDNSSFDSPIALFDGDDDQIETVWKNSYSLKEFLKPSEFKSYDELKGKLDRVLGAADFKVRSAETVELQEEVVTSDSSTNFDEDVSTFQKWATE